MSFFNKFLFFSFFVALVSCSPNNREHRREDQRANESFSLVFSMFSEAIDEYREVIELLKEERDIYNEMIYLSYKVNRMHNKIVQRQQLGLDSLHELKRQVEDLADILLDSMYPIPEGVLDKLDVIQSDLGFMEDLINGTEDIKTDKFDADEDEDRFYRVEDPSAVEDQQPLKETAERQDISLDSEKEKDIIASEAEPVDEEVTEEPALAPANEEEATKEPVNEEVTEETSVSVSSEATIEVQVETEKTVPIETEETVETLEEESVTDK